MVHGKEPRLSTLYWNPKVRVKYVMKNVIIWHMIDQYFRSAGVGAINIDIRGRGLPGTVYA